MIGCYDSNLWSLSAKLAVFMTAGKTFVIEEFMCDRERRYAQHTDEHM